MKTIAISSFFVLFALAVGVGSPAFADHSEVTVEAAAGSGVPGCEETDEGCYIPSTATVDVGGVVIFTNPDTAAHTYTSGNPSDGPDGVFDSSLVMVEGSFEWSPTTVGEQPYFCMVHPWMQGVIIVQEVGAAEKDDHGHDNGHMDDKGHLTAEASATGMMSDGTQVSVWTSEPMAGERMEVHVEFVDAEHVNHDITVTQNGETVLDDMGAHHHEGSGMHETAPLSSADPVDITITFQGYGIDEMTGPVGERVVFTNVVPEFGTIAMMILAVAIISIVAVTAKSRVVPRF
ncbi:MAG: PEFG-CTERM sorting domain-containing protein [Nitrosopumilus sp. (ex Thoosa mismalolli)]|nr:PEFG-CTERM sorting domain-containing protein [Nitrosopumilus sp. (ex Thoosa mismalolli)]